MQRLNQPEMTKGSLNDLQDYCDRSRWLEMGEPGRTMFLMTRHSLEYADEQQAKQIAENVFYFLAAGGRWRIVLPDARHPGKLYQLKNHPEGFTQKTLAALGKPHHKTAYDVASLTAFLETIGFIVEPLIYRAEEKYLNIDYPQDQLTLCETYSILFPGKQTRSERDFDDVGLIVDAVKPISLEPLSEEISQ